MCMYTYIYIYVYIYIRTYIHFTAENKQTPLVMRMKYQVTSPDHNFAIGEIYPIHHSSSVLVAQGRRYNQN